MQKRKLERLADLLVELFEESDDGEERDEISRVHHRVIDRLEGTDAT